MPRIPPRTVSLATVPLAVLVIAMAPALATPSSDPSRAPRISADRGEVLLIAQEKKAKKVKKQQNQQRQGAPSAGGREERGS